MNASARSVGKPLDRVDGRVKVTGAAKFAAEVRLPGALHAVIVQSRIACGRIRWIDASSAEAAPGVRLILTPRNMPRLRQPGEDFSNGGKLGEDRLPLLDDLIHYSGQHVAVVVADSPEQARFAAGLLRIEYEPAQPLLDSAAAAGSATQPKDSFGEEAQDQRGDVDTTLETLPDGAVRVEATYTTPPENHHPMEPSATVAAWTGNYLTVYDSTQWVMGARAILAEAFNLPRENVRVICPFVGGGFGCKGFTWPHTLLAAVCAAKTGRPVKLVLSRTQMFTAAGHRTPTAQAMVLAAGADGKLLAIQHVTTTRTSKVTDFVEVCGTVTSRMLYACPNVVAPHDLLHVNVPTPTTMRAPGECPGSFALESAMDELAALLKIDPVKFRVINHADVHPATEKPWSGKHLKECYQTGAEKFGWARRKPQPGSMRDGSLLVGWGMATATYPGFRFSASAKVQFFADGSASVSSATDDPGTGAYTVFTQIAADALELPVEKVRFYLGDSNLPSAPVADRSSSTATVSQAIIDAAAALKARFILMANEDPKSPLAGLAPDQLTVSGAKVIAKKDPSKSVAFAGIMARSGQAFIEAEAESKPSAEDGQFAFQSFGAHFCEVKIDPRIPRVRVSRFVGVFDNGRVINPKTSRSQAAGGIIMGIGMALMEETVYDRDRARIVNASLVDYRLPVNADIGSIETYFIDEPDPHINSLGCRGIGEIGITGVAAAVANAVWHATGKRIRDLPITPDKLL